MEWEIVDAVRVAFERKDYGGRFKPLQRSDATEFHLLSMREECVRPFLL